MKQRLGKVWLVGAGPGNIGLFTLKGFEVLKDCDVVVHDNLVGTEILNLISQNTRKIDVGKKPHYHKVPQEEINQILLDEALSGNKVVRLKGGDPFLFGRGGEELELLIKNNIDYEIVPGITSAISAPAFAGIPVTHRDYCSSVHIITGHTKLNNGLIIDYDSLYKIGGTLIFMMSVSPLKEICDGLISAGMSPDMPAAIIENGTTSRQRKVVSKVKDLYEKSLKAFIKSPAVVVIGEVAGLSNSFDWTGNRPLNGKKIIVTRPEKLISKLSMKIRDLGGEAIEFPTIKISEIKSDEFLIQRLKNLKNYKWIVFTSRAGVQIFLSKFRKDVGDIRNLFALKIAVIGSGTREEFTNYGIIPDFMPDNFNVLELAQGLVGLLGKDEKIAVIRAKEGSKDLNEVFDSHSIKYDDIPIYETEYNTQGCEFSQKVIEKNNFDMVAFTSASTVKGFVNVFPNYNFSQVKALCIGDQTKEEACKYGMKTITSKQATLDGMIEAMIEYFNSER